MVSDRMARRIEIAALAIVFGAGSGWSALQFGLSSLTKTVERIDARVAEMYCAQVPVEKRPGCR